MNAAPEAPGAPRLYPVGLVVAGRRCLVVGAGPIAARKAESLLDCGAQVSVVAPDISPEMAQLVGHSGAWLELHCRPYMPGEAAEYWFVIAATGIPQVDGQVFVDAEAARVWINAADDPAHCSVMLPSVLRRGNLAVAVSTDGRSPAMSAWLRRRLEAHLPRELANLVDAAAEKRALDRASEIPSSPEDWKRFFDSSPAAP